MVVVVVWCKFIVCIFFFVAPRWQRLLIHTTTTFVVKLKSSVAKKNTDTHIQTIAIFYFRVNLERHHTVFSMINLTCKIQIAWFNSEKLIVFHEKLQGEPWIITNLLTFWLAISLTPLIFFMQFIILRRSLFSKHSVIRIYFAFRAIDWYNTINWINQYHQMLVWVQ